MNKIKNKKLKQKLKHFPIDTIISNYFYYYSPFGLLFSGNCIVPVIAGTRVTGTAQKLNPGIHLFKIYISAVSTFNLVGGTIHRRLLRSARCMTCIDRQLDVTGCRRRRWGGHVQRQEPLLRLLSLSTEDGWMCIIMLAKLGININNLDSAHRIIIIMSYTEALMNKLQAIPPSSAAALCWLLVVHRGTQE